MYFVFFFIHSQFNSNQSLGFWLYIFFSSRKFLNDLSCDYWLYINLFFCIAVNILSLHWIGWLHEFCIWEKKSDSGEKKGFFFICFCLHNTKILSRISMSIFFSLATTTNYSIFTNIRFVMSARKIMSFSLSLIYLTRHNSQMMIKLIFWN